VAESPSAVKGPGELVEYCLIAKSLVEANGLSLGAESLTELFIKSDKLLSLIRQVY